ncbi:MAG: hypothetical protein LBP69_02820 [Treponema sp.]|jgi:hypothetical protein|nr:hypothetical protein [Treponema sp.]
MIIPEDGTGVPDSNAYADSDFAANYFRGKTLAAWNDIDVQGQEDMLVFVSGYIDTAFNWKGLRKTPEQGLSWPRTGVVLDGFDVEGVPAAVKKAVCETVRLCMNGESLYSTDAGKEITSAGSDGMSVHYARNEKAVTRFEIINRLLRGLYRLDTDRIATVGSCRVERV